MFFLPCIVSKESKIAGMGLFSTRDILRGTVLWVVDVRTETELLTKKQIDELDEDVRNRWKKYAMQVDEDLWSLSADMSIYINHSCFPNCYFINPSVCVAFRDISAGEELTYDYGGSDSVLLDDEQACMCGSAACRKRITPDDWKSIDDRLVFKYMKNMKKEI